MAERVQQVNFKLVAHDETKGAVQSALANLRELQLEQRRSGEHALESLLKGGGIAGLVMFGIEAEGKAAEAADKSLRKYLAGQESFKEASVEGIEGIAKSIPIISAMGETVDKSAIFWGHLSEAAAKYLGISGQNIVTQSLLAREMSNEAQRVEELTAHYDRLRSTMDAAARLRGEHGLAKQEDETKLAVARQYAGEREKLRKIIDDDGKSEAEQEDATQKLLGLDKAIAAEQAITVKEVRDTAWRDYIKTERQGQEELRRIDAEINADRLREAGLMGAARTAILKQQFDQEAAALRQRAAEEQHEHPERRDQPTRAAEAVIAEKQKRLDDELARAAREDHQRKLDDLRTFNRQLESAEAEAQADILRLQGRDFEAQDLLRRTHEQRELDDLRAFYSKRIELLNRAGGDQATAESGRLIEERNRLLAAVKEKHDAESELARKQLSDVTQQNQQDADKTLMEARIDLLKQQADMGNTLADQEARRLEILQKTRDELDGINKKLRDGKDLSDQQKKELLDARQLIIAGAAQGLKNTGAAEDAKGLFAPGEEAGRGVVGIKDAFQASYQEQQQKLLDVQNRALDALIKIGTALGQGIPFAQLLDQIVRNTAPQTTPATDQLN